ncbi:S-adenosyl-L-methionine-dependent methyltransferase [Aspergillus pseudodeflectus]|uniref:S-adenosyl-L-methionine-dependent methyltransferase n=1 Tax=Aspergillus pseudodeflectus TaxID=176178 RepID=A0ABR4JP44_9EURO
MSQNAYDEPLFFAGYSELPRSQKGINGALEWPLLQALVGDVQGYSVLDLGCGFGWFCRWAHENGAQKVHGIDISRNMLEKAKSLTRYPAVTYSIGDLDTIKLEKDSYDLVYSALAFHYLTNIKELFGQVYDRLKPGGRFVFSVEHPIFTGPIVAPAWTTGAGGTEAWGVDSYAEEGLRKRDWLGKEVFKQHRTVDTYVSLLLSTRFILTALKEWMPTTEYVKDHPEWKRERIRPLFLILAAQKPKEAQH